MATQTNRRHIRSKEYGREVENAALKALRVVFPNLKRIGSPGYSKAHPDLMQEPSNRYFLHMGILNDPLNLLVTRQKGGQMLVTMRLADFIEIVNEDKDRGVRVQCKGRAQMLVHRWYQELLESK
jgi:hypothetical protein